MAEHESANRPSADDALLSSWVQEFHDPLLRFFYKRVPGTVEAEDLVQEVFLRLARRADLASIDKVEGYLFQTAASVIADRFRRDGVRREGQHEPYEDDTHGGEGFSPERVLMGKQAVQTLIDALFELPERTRNVFVLYHFDRMRQVDIARRLKIGLSTVEKHMARANAHLLKRVGP